VAGISRSGIIEPWWIEHYVGERRICHTLRTTHECVTHAGKRGVETGEATGQLSGPPATPLAEFLEDFCRYLSARRTRKSYSTERSLLRVFFGPICPALEFRTSTNARYPNDGTLCVDDRMRTFHVHMQHLEDVTPALIESFITRRILECGIAPKTANRYREILHVMFNYAIRTRNFESPDHRFPNPVAAVQRHHEPPRSIRFLSAEAIADQLSVLEPYPTIRVLVAVYIYAGLRREEALWLTHDDVDLERRLIRVVAKTVDGEFWQPKTRRNRVVPVSKTLLHVIRSHVPKQACRWYFPSPAGKRWDSDNFSHDLRAINGKHGLPWSCLDFRHTFGSHLAQKGESLYKIAELMGNSPDICRRHYAALIPEKMHDVVEFEKAEQPDETKVLLRQILFRLDQVAAPRR